MSLPRTTLDLLDNWTVREADTDSAPIPAIVPGCVHHDLLQAGAIPDPYVRENELEVQWIGERDWEYTCSFEVAEELLGRDRIDLVCEGLDTLADIRLNDQPVAETDNMFRMYRLAVKELLVAGKNTLNVRFRSARKFTAQKENGRHLATPKCCAHEFYGRPYLRKEQCNFGWDWGPVLVTCGIWQPIRLEAHDVARIDDVLIKQDHRKDGVTLTVDVGVVQHKQATLGVGVEVMFEGKTIAQGTGLLHDGKASVNIDITNPLLWWPAGMGEQPLYDVTVSLNESGGTSLDTAHRRIGLRRLQLVREKDEWGESFEFACNGRNFFAKGANWIPTDQIKPRITEERLRDLIQSAVDANMNMIRVWGGGIYETDTFFDLCDELGLCVWQDFMFACSSYPTDDPKFAENVAEEAEDQIKRLRHRASLALWCGNNELEMGVAKKNREDQNWPLMPWPEYEKIFDHLLAEKVSALDPHTAYWPCSPHSPTGNRDHHSNDACGDQHHWAVWHGKQPFEWYRSSYPRFCSEFGFQSFPEPRTVAEYAPTRDEANIYSPVMEHHQRSSIGNTTIMQYMGSWFPMPDGPESLLWLSQIQQGLSIQYAVEHWRRNMERCRGALYWQLNDCWPVASWASIDYYHRWKALHYLAKRFFAPLLIGGIEDPEKKQVQVFCASDRAQPADCRVDWAISNTSGKILDTGSHAFVARPDEAADLFCIDCADTLEKVGPRDCLIWLKLFEGDALVSHNLVSFVKPKHMHLHPVKHEVSVRKVAERTFELEVGVDHPSLWTWFSLEKTDARWSDSFACLQPGHAYTFSARTSEDISLQRFEEELKIRSIRDCY